jgi:antitoxin ParD1/3/4
MNISLTEELHRFVEQKVESGLYHSASEVIREGLRLLIQYEHQRDSVRLKLLNDAIAQGLQTSSWTSWETVIHEEKMQG